MSTIESIIKNNLKFLKKGLVYFFLNNSISSKFYSELYADKPDRILPELYYELKRNARKKDNSNITMNKILHFFENNLHKDAIVIEIGGNVYQERSANAYSRFVNYFPLDISDTNISLYCQTFLREGIVADATNLPFEDSSVDCIFTHTFLEHPIEPEKVLAEISRVLKPGGIVAHHDAWFCRWWQHYGLVGFKRFSKMDLKEKVIYMLSKLTELKSIRIPPIIIRRIIRKMFNYNRKEIPLVYKKLKPNYKLFLGSDEDAASSIDPFDVIMYYESREYTLINDPGFLKRFLLPNTFILLKKGE